MGTVLDETNVSIEAAIADKTLDPKISAGPIAALRELAMRIDGLDVEDYAARGIEVTPAMIEAALKDNVSLPTYLKACEALRLTPASRADIKAPKGGGRLARLRDGIDDDDATTPAAG